MVQLVSLTEVQNALRIDGDDDDGALYLAIEAASGAVLNYLKAGKDAFMSDGEIIAGMEVPAEVRIATILLVGEWRRNPDNNVEGAFERGYLPMPVTALLYPLRDPAIA